MNFYVWSLIACWTVFIVYWAISAFNVKQDIRGSWWQRMGWARIVVIAIVLAWLSRDRSFGHYTHFIDIWQPMTTPALATIGVALCVIGTALAIWARVHLGRNWSPIPTLKQEHELVTSGPYQLIRHPIYTGIILSALGSGLVLPFWLVILIIIVAMFVWRVYREEALMLKQFPNQYPAYK